MKTAKEVLVAARKLIEREESWGQFLYVLTGPDGTVKKRCVRNAIDVVTINDPGARTAACMALAEVVRRPINHWNDTNPHEVIMAGMDAAITSLPDATIALLPQ